MWKAKRMAGDLGTGAGEVHDAAAAVLRFWLVETPAEKRFAKDAALDAEIARRFAAARQDAVSRPEAWRGDPNILLAAVILIDQFSRNMFRDSASAFTADPIARGLASFAIEQGWDHDLSPAERHFLYMPFMHSEDRADQQRSLALFSTLPDDVAKYARTHADQIDRFGRFPGRNAALGREDTAAERDFLSQPGARF